MRPSRPSADRPAAAEPLDQILPPPTLPGVTFTVNTSDDVDDGVCNTTHCSFCEAINAVNSRANSIFVHLDTIAFNLTLGPHFERQIGPGGIPRCFGRLVVNPFGRTACLQSPTR